MIHIQPRLSSIGSTILSSLEGVLISAEKRDIEVHYDNTTDYTAYNVIAGGCQS